MKPVEEAIQMERNRDSHLVEDITNSKGEGAKKSGVEGGWGERMGQLLQREKRRGRVTTGLL